MTVFGACDYDVLHDAEARVLCSADRWPGMEEL